MTGYALALWNVRWAGTFLFVLFICAFVPFQIIMIPLIVVVASLGIYGTVWAIALVHAVLAMPLLTLIFRNFYKDIPRELINAAIMDSGSFWRIFVEIILPMSGNIMVVVLILMITTVWNDYLVGLTFGGIGAKPMTVILANSVDHLARRGRPQRQHGGGAAHRDSAARRLLRARAASSSRASPPARSRDEPDAARTRSFDQISSTSHRGGGSEAVRTRNPREGMMLRRKLAGIGLALAFGVLPFTANAVELTLWHSWSNESEMAALNTIVDEFVSARQHGRRRLDPARDRRREPAGQPVRRRHAAEPLHRGAKPTSSGPRREGPGPGRRPLFDKIGATQAFPKTVLDAITIDGKVLKIPVAVHIDGMVYYNKKVAEAAGVDPTKWQSLDDMWADQKKVNDAGYTFIAIGGNTFQAGYTFHPLLAAIAGPDIYYRFYAGTPDKTVFDEPAVKQAIETLGKIFRADRRGLGQPRLERHHQHRDQRHRADADPRRLDEGRLAGQRQAGRRRLRLHQHPRHQGAVGDGRLLRHPRRRRRRDAQGRGGASPRSSSIRRSTPSSPSSRDRARSAIDVPTDKLDACNKVVLDSLAKPDYSVQNPFYIGDLDWINSVWNTMFTYQSDPDMTADQVIEMLKEEYDAVFG